MSVDIASLPPWKLALIERKRRQDSTETSNNASKMESVDLSCIPPWKQEILIKRQQKKTTILIESLPNENVIFGGQERRSQTDIMSPFDGHSCHGISISGWHSEMFQRRNESSESDIMAFGRQSNKPEDRNSIYKYDDDDDINGIPVMAERLPPINQNPILLKDLEKRQHTGLNQSVVGLQSPNSYENVLPDLGGKIVMMSENEDVFGENDEEVAYGKGFVHRLLRKFSHLADKEDHVTSVPPVQWSRSLSRGYSTDDFIKPQTICSPTTSGWFDSSLNKCVRKKVYSLDDLLNDKKDECSVSQAGSMLNFRSSDANTVRKNGFEDEGQQLKGNDRSMPGPDSPDCSIVFTARSIFENLATSPVAATKSSVHNRHSFSCDVVLTKPEPQLMLKNRVQHHHHHHDNDNVIIENHVHKSAERNAYSPAIIHPKPNWRLGASIKSDKNQLRTVVDNKKSGGNSLNSPIITIQKPFLISNNISTVDNEERKLIGRSNDAISSSDSESMTLSSEKSQHHTTKLDKTDITATLGNIPLKPALTDTSSIHWQKTNGCLNQDHEKIAVTINESFNKSEDTSFQNGSKLLKKSSPSRPGMLLIRPASNLVTSKAKTDYVEMVKYNDITRGDFAPLAKITIPKVRDEENDDELDSIMNDPSSILKFTKVKFEFEGAGVRVGRSLLTKSKVGEKLRIRFDDSATTTFEYPSEQSILDSFPSESDDFDFPNVDSVTAQYSYNPITTQVTFDRYEKREEDDSTATVQSKEDDSDEEIVSMAM